MNRLTAVLVALASLTLALFPPTVSADTAVGETTQLEYYLGSRRFFLPPGKWTVIAERDGKTTSPSPGVNAGAATKAQYLVQVNEANVLVAALYVATTLSTMQTGGWNDDFCERKDLFFLEKLDGDFKHPACIAVNFVSNFWRSAEPPSGDMNRTIWQYFKDKGTVLPTTAVNVLYTKYHVGDYVQLRYFLNPDVAGVKRTAIQTKGVNVWHASVIAESPDRQQYMELVKAWARPVAESTRGSLVVRESGNYLIPALPSMPK